MNNWEKMVFSYKLYLEDNTLVDSSGDEPITHIVGKGEIIPKIEEALQEMNIGEKKTIFLEPNEGYGKYNEDNVLSLDKNKLQIDNNVSNGQYVDIVDDNENTYRGKVLEIDENNIVIDFNHPLCDKRVYFELELVDAE
ncbi:MAG: FKBP-type peptidyl-prolyl cis-trans isomerase [Deferribacterota bacterium]|nr:FKBP-type peptidyl-prolyl cis-trans isomerase [Deferribacterota bacterium]